MTVLAVPELAEQITNAATNERKSRHFHECRCGMYQNHWCNPQEKFWWNSVDRLLTEMRHRTF